MRCKAVENLSESRHPSDTERIFASLYDPNPQVRCAAVRALVKAETPDSQTSLVHALQDESFEVREAAARGLGRLGALGAAGDLAVCLRDPDASVRIAAASALRAMGWKPATREESAWFEITLGNVPAAVSASVPLPEPPFTESNQETSFYRRLAVAELQERNDPRRISSLLAALRSTDLLARIGAVHDLGQVNNPEITKELLALLRDPDPEVRLVAVQVLAVRDDSPPSHFLGLLLDSNPEVRLAAVQFFGRIHAQQVAEVLRPLLHDPSLHVRQAAAAAMGPRGMPVPSKTLQSA
jgi:HEAT repeat protein